MLAHAALILVGMTQATATLGELDRLIKTEPVKAAAQIRQRFKPENLRAGIDAVDEGTNVLVAFEGETGARQAVLLSGANGSFSLSKLDDTLFAAVIPFADGDGGFLKYVVDGVEKRTISYEVYRSNPFTLAPPGGMKGELRAMGELKSVTFPGTTRKWFIYLPPGLELEREYPVLIGCDAQWDRDWMANALENCAREGKIAPTVGIFIEPGQDKPGTYSNRSKEYDSLSDSYARFLLDEILPAAQKIVKLSSDPSKRAVSGMSSGGICSFTACWERPDQFGTAISFVGSFANIASGDSKREGGHNYPFLIRKTEPKPIRVFLQDGENDLNNDHGSWWICNLQMQSALAYKGYDAVWVPGRGFHNTKHARRIFDQALTWWQKDR